MLPNRDGTETRMDTRKVFVRCAQAAAVFAVYAAWLATQALLEKTRGVVPTFIDHTHHLLGGANAFLNAHPTLSNVVLAASSFEVDLAAFSMVSVLFQTKKKSTAFGTVDHPGPPTALPIFLLDRAATRDDLALPGLSVDRRDL